MLVSNSDGVWRSNQPGSQVSVCIVVMMHICGPVLHIFWTDTKHSITIGTFYPFQSINNHLQIVGEIFYFLNAHSTMTTVWSMICLRNKQPYLSRGRMVSQTGQKNIVSIKFELVKSSSYPNDSIGPCNVMHCYPALK
jgi:hypothetical protein